MSLRVIFDACEPRDEVLRGDLRDEMFAARLRDVMEGRADPVYQEAKRFFDHTFPTEGLRTLVREALGRLSGRQLAPPSVLADRSSLDRERLVFRFLREAPFLPNAQRIGVATSTVTLWPHQRRVVAGPARPSRSARA
jgi:hypothetical protein